MKSKLALMLMTAVGSSALVVPAPGQPFRVAQEPQPPPARNFTYVVPGEVPQPPLPPTPPPPGQPGLYPPVPLPPPTFGGFGLSGRFGSPEEANLAREADQLARQLGEARSDSDRDRIKAKLGEA